jgi:hypothetical protein
MSIKGILKSFATGLLILLGIQAVAYYYTHDVHNFWWLIGGDVAILAGLDLRFQTVRVSIKQQIIKIVRESGREIEK